MKKKLATDELFLEATKRKISVALLQEPYVGAEKRLRNYQGARIFQNTEVGDGIVKTAVAVMDSTLDVIQYPQLTTNNITVVGIRTGAWRITLVSVYLEKDMPIAPYLEHLEKIGEELGPRKLIIGGDVNAWNTWWGSAHTNSRGEDVANLLDQLGLQILNTDAAPTFDCVRGGRRFTSNVDVTACSADVAVLAEDWKTVEDFTSSDHNAIAFHLRLEKSRGFNINRTTRLYNTRKANWAQFNSKLNQLKVENTLTCTTIEQLQNKTEIEQTVNTYTDIITQACTSTIPKKKQNDTLTLPWWSEELAEMKRTVAARKQRIRCAAPVRRAKVVEEYLQKKEEYELAVERARTESWKNFCEKQDGEGVWNGIYRVIGRTSKRDEDIPLTVEGEVLDARGSVQALAETFFPEDLATSDNAEHRRVRAKSEIVNDSEQGELWDPPFTQTELQTAMRAFNPKKAPGADGFTADICREAVNNEPELFLNILNKCFELSHFPDSWKEATVIVLRKPGKTTYTSPKSYRPIGLLPVLGKVFEKMLFARLRFHLLPRMSTRQFGFTPQKSTEDSLYILMQHIKAKVEQKKIVTMVSLDIEGAFDSAWWPAIKVRLAEEKCPVNLRRLIDSYLRNRRVKVRYAGEEIGKETNKGCIQGSIGGPLLWNLLLDSLLKELESRGDYVQAFADDIVLIFDGDTAQQIERQANETLELVRAWGVANKLRFAPHKTLAMVITRKLKYDTPRLSMGGVSISMSKEIKLLGLTIDEGLTFNAHAANACRKALGFYRRLSCAARVSWGLKPDIIRTMYTAVVEPVILYAASVWAPASNKIGIKKELNNVQRGFAQKMIKAYKTVSLNSALLIAGILPLDIRIREAALLYEVKKGYSRHIVGDREIEQPARFAEAPHPARQAEIQFRCVEDGAALEQYHGRGIDIFTDGSKIEGKVGAAYTVMEGDREIHTKKLRLDQCCSVYQAELLALHEAMERALKSRAPSCNVYCDSRSALETVTNHSCLHPLAVKIRERIHQLTAERKEVNLFWIKAHVGLQGNERADELAKSAALRLKTKADYDRCPVSFVKRQIRMESLGEWNRRYQVGETASTTKAFFPDAIKAYKIVRNVKLDPVTVQVLTGHGGFSSYLHRFKCKESPACDCDPAVEQSTLHVITSCPVYGRRRYEAENEMGIEIRAENLFEILECTKTRNIFLKFCNEVAQKVILKNR